MPLPNRIFKYEALSTQILRNLKGQVLYFGSPQNFNDPYDCALNPRIKPISDEHVEEVRRHLIQEKLTDQRRELLEGLSIESLRNILLRSATKTINGARDDFLNTKGVT